MFCIIQPMNPGVLIAAAIIVSSGISGTLGFVLAKKEPAVAITLISPEPQTQISSFTPTSSPAVKVVPSLGLQNAIDSVLKDSVGTYAVVVKDLKTKETYTRNANLQFEAASLYKLWVMAQAFNEISSGDLSEDEVLSSSITALNSSFQIPSHVAELTTGSISMTVEQALDRMITISHNYAALLLIEKLSLPDIKNFIESNGFTQTIIGDGSITTANDVSAFLEKIYYGQLISSDSSAGMLSLLKRQTLNTKIPKYLPTGVVIAHKTGELDNVTHDAGIVYSPKATYILIILTKSDSPPGADERISGISQAVYSYFNPK